MPGPASLPTGRAPPGSGTSAHQHRPRTAATPLPAGGDPVGGRRGPQGRRSLLPGPGRNRATRAPMTVDSVPTSAVSCSRARHIFPPRPWPVPQPHRGEKSYVMPCSARPASALGSEQGRRDFLRVSHQRNRKVPHPGSQPPSRNRGRPEPHRRRQRLQLPSSWRFPLGVLPPPRRRGGQRARTRWPGGLASSRHGRRRAPSAAAVRPGKRSR